MKKTFISILLGFLLIIPSSVLSIELPLPHEPPIQASGIEIVGDYSAVAWDANIEPDLDGYLIGYSVNTSGFVYDANQITDVGNVTQFTLSDLPESIKKDGNKVYLVVYAYDTHDNVSGASESVDIDFFVDSPPNSPSGLEKQ